MLKRDSVADLVASEMERIVESPEHRSVFAKPKTAAEEKAEEKKKEKAEE